MARRSRTQILKRNNKSRYGSGHAARDCYKSDCAVHHPTINR